VIVVDTSVLIDFFRGANTQQVDVLERMENDLVPFMIPAVCCQELLQGARDNNEWRLLNSYLSTQRVLVSSDPVATHFNAARIYYDARKKGISLRSTIDCLIAQQVLEIKGSLLHSDRDFDRIGRIRPLKMVHD